MRLAQETTKNPFLAVFAFGVLVWSIVRLWHNNAVLGLVNLDQNQIALRI